jgi:hypothetical protein
MEKLVSSSAAAAKEENAWTVSSTSHNPESFKENTYTLCMLRCVALQKKSAERKKRETKKAERKSHCYRKFKLPSRLINFYKQYQK